MILNNVNDSIGITNLINVILELGIKLSLLLLEILVMSVKSHHVVCKYLFKKQELLESS